MIDDSAKQMQFFFFAVVQNEISHHNRYRPFANGKEGDEKEDEERRTAEEKEGGAETEKRDTVDGNRVFSWHF